jgi:uncharacterized protein (TIGR02145 family)
MKTIVNKIGIWLTVILVAFMGACKQDPSLYGSEEETPHVLTIAVSEEDITLHPDMEPGQEVLTVTWNEAAPRGPYDEIIYVVKIDLADNVFETAVREEIPAGIFSKGFTYQELYELLTEKWRVELGSAVGIDVRVIATVYGPKFVRPEIATTRVNMKIFMPDPKPLYIMGTAVPNGGSDTDFGARKIQMTESVPGKEYTLSDSLTTGNFIFVTDETNVTTLLPAYVKGSHDTLLVLVETASQLNNKFTATNGRYNITVRIDRLTAKINKKTIIGGQEWAPNNVDSKGIFAATTDARGKLYQFHYDIGYSATDPIDPVWQVSTDKEDSYWHSSTIPCPEGWTLPEGSNLAALVNAGSTWANANEKGNAVAGRFFGTGHATATIGNLGDCIFIPAAGRRDSQTGALIDAGVKGFVHSKNPYWGETSQVMVFSETEAKMVYARATEAGGSEVLLGTAMSVRCIKK